MPELTITVSGVPVPQPRARTFVRGGRSMTWDPAHDAKIRARAEIAKQIDEMIPNVPIEIFVKFILPIPKSTSKKARVRMLANEIKHIKRPDTDNYCKMCFDCLNSIAFKDDSQLWHVDAVKMYGEEPMTVIKLKY